MVDIEPGMWQGPLTEVGDKIQQLIDEPREVSNTRARSWERMSAQCRQQLINAALRRPSIFPPDYLSLPMTEVTRAINDLPTGSEVA